MSQAVDYYWMSLSKCQLSRDYAIMHIQRGWPSAVHFAHDIVNAKVGQKLTDAQKSRVKTIVGDMQGIEFDNKPKLKVM